jgi:hypothetical protein
MDDNNVYAEVPSIHSPCILRFPISEGGLSKCLAILGAHRSVEHSGPIYNSRPATSQKLMAAGVTQADMDIATSTLKRIGVGK